jgi:hypothetical protein
LPRVADRPTLVPCGVRSVNGGACDPTGSRSAPDGGAAADAGFASICPTPGSVVGEKPTAFAASTSARGAFLSAAGTGAADGACGAVPERSAATRTTTSTRAAAVPQTT